MLTCGECGRRSDGAATAWRAFVGSEDDGTELFTSPALAERLGRCVAFDPTEWYAFSDHSPIVATFED